MDATLWLIPALPLLGFMTLALLPRMPERRAAITGVGTAALSTIASTIAAAHLLLSPPQGGAWTSTLGQWMRVGDFSPAFSLHLDALALVMVLVVNVTALLILVYSADFMRGEEGYQRFFAYMNLFLASMLLLVLADDLLVLYLGWEAVGVCSYLLIGFWYREPANGTAARKAFLVTRLGDAAMAVGLVLLFRGLGTLEIPELLSRAAAQWTTGSPEASLAAWLLLVGALAKSAQVPLHVWLPDAMAGPAPVSALLHAATLVTAGVYLLARLHGLFERAPDALAAAAVIGAVTVLLAGVSAAAQEDIKRAAAYSTISQVGYMYLALGVGAWSAAVCHFAAHAFFKSLLFLCAGVIIHALDGEHSLFKMRGLRRALPSTFAAFAVGSLALAGLPPTGGFASKERILSAVYAADPNGWLFLAAWAGAFLTGLYSFRLLGLAFGGAADDAAPPRIGRRPTAAMRASLAVLAALCVASAALCWPEAWGGNTELAAALRLPFLDRAPAAAVERTPSLAALLASLAGAACGWYIATAGRGPCARLCATGAAAALHAWWREGWGFDSLYRNLVALPVCRLAELNRADAVDAMTQLFTRAALSGHRRLSAAQNGRLGWYAGGLALGFILLLALMLWT